jgi:hypothetical protein
MRQGCQHVHSLQISCSLAQPLAVLIAVIFESGGGALHRQWQQTGRRPARRDDARSNCSASARAGKRERHKAHLYPQCFGIEKYHGAGCRASCARRVVCADEQHSGKRRRLFVCTVSNFKSFQHYHCTQGFYDRKYPSSWNDSACVVYACIALLCFLLFG